VPRQQLLHLALLAAQVCRHLLLQLLAQLAHRLLCPLQRPDLLGGLRLQCTSTAVQ
jgi:hypothetical protein